MLAFFFKCIDFQLHLFSAQAKKSLQKQVESRIPLSITAHLEQHNLPVKLHPQITPGSMQNMSAEKHRFTRRHQAPETTG